MYRAPKLILMAALLLSGGAFAQEEYQDQDNSVYAPSVTDRMLFHSPVYLPREALLGAFVGNGPIVLQLRLKWEFTLYHLRRDTLFWSLEGGGGLGVNLPTAFDSNGNPPLTTFHEYIAMAGAGYRVDLEGGFHIDIEAGIGLLFYGGRDVSYREGYDVGTFEGRVKVGWRADHVIYGAFLSDDVPFSRSPQSLFGGYAGGLFVGLFVNWH